MSNARQRALLSALGIWQWIPRAVKTVASKKSATGATAAEQLWRQGDDEFYHASASSHLTTQFEATNVKETNYREISNQAIAMLPGSHSTSIDSISAKPLSHAAIINPDLVGQPDIHHHTVTHQQNSELAITITQAGERGQNHSATLNLSPHLSDQFQKNNADQSDTVLLEVDHQPLLMSEAVSNTINFRLQACEINQWIVLVNEEDLQDPLMQTLWQNILKAFNQPAIINFSWPLSEGQRWQRTTGAKSALNGFLFRMGLDKRVGLMSELPDDICPDRLERLPHLAELLAEPLKKRTLWHLLKVQ